MFENSKRPESILDKIRSESPFLESYFREKAIEYKPVNQNDSYKATKIDVGLFIHDSKEIETECQGSYEYSR